MPIDHNIESCDDKGHNHGPIHGGGHGTFKHFKDNFNTNNNLFSTYGWWFIRFGF